VFLEHIREHRLYALYHLVTFRGLRRGEACGIQWTEFDLDAATLNVAWQIVQLGWKTDVSKPKTDASDAVIALDGSR
jgi:hypothetical protein